MHAVVVVRVLRHAGHAVTIRDVATRTGLPVYVVQAALNWLYEEKAAERDKTCAAWRYTAVDRQVTPGAGGPAAPATG